MVGASFADHLRTCQPQLPVHEENGDQSGDFHKDFGRWAPGVAIAKTMVPWAYNIEIPRRQLRCDRGKGLGIRLASKRERSIHAIASLNARFHTFQDDFLFLELP
jgi:hypothetical protein